MMTCFILVLRNLFNLFFSSFQPVNQEEGVLVSLWWVWSSILRTVWHDVHRIGHIDRYLSTGTLNVNGRSRIVWSGWRGLIFST